jgi:hypothetical protein
MKSISGSKQMWNFFFFTVSVCLLLICGFCMLYGKFNDPLVEKKKTPKHIPAFWRFRFEKRRLYFLIITLF